MIATADVERAFPELFELDDRLRSLVLAFWHEVSSRNPAHSDLSTFPLHPTLPVETHGTLVQHVRGMVKMSLALVPTYRDVWGISLDRDAFLAACFVHDAAKVVEFVVKDGALVATPGFNHAIEAGRIARELDFPEPIAHMCEAHSFAGPLVLPRTREAQLLQFLDGIALNAFPGMPRDAWSMHLGANGWQDPKTLERYRAR